MEQIIYSFIHLFFFVNRHLKLYICSQFKWQLMLHVGQNAKT